MHPVLARKLIEAKAIKAGSECEFFERPGYLAVGTFSITGARLLKDEAIMFDIVNHRGDKFRIHCSLLHSVDGMTAKRIASIFNMNEQGDPIPVGRRRGRKPKGRVVETVEAKTGWADTDEEEDAASVE